jgi:hypothetical protein
MKKIGEENEGEFVCVCVCVCVCMRERERNNFIEKQCKSTFTNFLIAFSLIVLVHIKMILFS